MRQGIPHATSDSRSDTGGDVWHGVRTALVPFIALVALVALTTVATAVARALAAPRGFLTWQWIVAGVWAGGLIITIVVYMVTTARALRRAAEWQGAGLQRQATGAYWTLAVTALIVLLPTLIALALPQHPAP